MRMLRILSLGAIAIAAAACSDDAGDAVSPTIPPLAFVRYINAVPDTLNTTVRWVDEVAYTPQTFINVAYRGMGQGNFQGLKAGSRRFKVFTADVVNFSVAGNTAVLVDTTITFEAGKYYTLLHHGYARAGSAPRQRIVVIEENIPTPGANIAVRAINAGMGLGAQDFYMLATTTTAIAGTPTVGALAEGARSTYTNVAPAAFAFRTAAPGTTTAVASGGAPAGLAAVAAAPGVVAADPVAGATIAGSVLTAIAFPASVVGSAAATAATPSVLFFVDKQPPRTTSP
ncbi:MAG: DUF4397 domain-containing protein [Gemmatimonadaceae bacterium]|nr:DUF4397 domain-containing protein [Gemmatimonadaceae bacterium]